MTLLVGALTMGLILSLLALGVYISFRVFGFPDITADGSITLGAAVAAALAVRGMNPFLGSVFVFAAGMAAGATTGILHTKFKINSLLSGILVMTALYSINLGVMGRSNIPLLDVSPRFTAADITRPSALAARLARGGDALSAYLMTRFPPDVRKALKDAEKSKPSSEDLRRGLAQGLNAAMGESGLFDEARFRGLKLSGATRRLLALCPVGDDLILLNRLLLDEAYPRDLARHRPIRTLANMAAAAGAWLAGGYSPLLSAQEALDPTKFALRIKKAADPVAKAISERLSPQTREQIDAFGGDSPPSPELMSLLVEDVNRLLRGGLWYDAKVFAEAKLTPSAMRRVAARPTGEALLRLNRRLLDEAFPKTLPTFVRVKPVPRLDVMGWEVDVADASKLVGSFLVVVVIGTLVYLFFRTNLGAAMRATGDNPDMIRALGVNVGNMIVFGLAVSNGLIALSGSLLAQYQGFADVQLGIGMIVTGLASVIIGESIVGHSGLGVTIVGAVIGSALFRLLLAIALRWGLNPNDLKLVTAVFVFAALALPMALGKLRKRKAGTAHA